MDDLIKAAKETAWIAVGVIVLLIPVAIYIVCGGPIPGMHR